MFVNASFLCLSISTVNYKCPFPIDVETPLKIPLVSCFTIEFTSTDKRFQKKAIFSQNQWCFLSGRVFISERFGAKVRNEIICPRSLEYHPARDRPLLRYKRLKNVI